MKTTIQQIKAEPGQRIIVVSDIHGHLNHLIQLLKKVNYSGDDILVIVGDVVDKGPDSLRTLQYVMELSDREQVYVSMGNVDLHRLQFLTDETEGADARFCQFVRWMKECWGGGLITDMMADIGLLADKLTEENAAEYRARLRDHFQEEIDFLASRPVVLESGRYIFVHGGLPTDDLTQVEGLPAEPFLKNDAFLKKEYFFERYMVVGHWPVCLYDDQKECVAPIFEQKKNIIAIDGGCGLKQVGQLNALLIPDQDAEMSELSWEFFDEFPCAIALEDQEPVAPTIHIQYFDSQVELLEERGDLLLLRHLSSGREFLVPTGHTWQKTGLMIRGQEEPTAGELHCDDYCDERLEIKAGDELSVIWETSIGCYAKCRGRIGWYCGKISEKAEEFQLVSGRPTETKYRRERELATYDLLERLGMQYSRIDHGEAKTMEACAAVDEKLDAVICKNLFLRNQQKTKFYLLMMPGDKKFKTKELSKQINSARLSFAEPEFLQKFLHISPGSVSVMGLMNDTENQVQLLIDRDVLNGEYFGCHPCVNTSSLRISLKELTEVFLPAIHHEPVFVDLTGEV